MTACRVPASVARWERLMRDIADEQGVFTAYSNLVGTEGGKRFFGGSLIVGPAGDVRVRAPMWEEHLVVATIDLDDLVRARADSPLLSDLRVALPHVLEQLRAVRANESFTVQYDGVEPAAADLLREARGFHTGEYAVPPDPPPSPSAPSRRSAAGRVARTRRSPSRACRCVITAVHRR
jgi:NAD+ synthase (glutamine-hydrolysing)